MIAAEGFQAGGLGCVTAAECGRNTFCYCSVSPGGKSYVRWPKVSAELWTAGSGTAALSHAAGQRDACRQPGGTDMEQAPCCGARVEQQQQHTASCPFPSQPPCKPSVLLAQAKKAKPCHWLRWKRERIPQYKERVGWGRYRRLCPVVKSRAVKVRNHSSVSRAGLTLVPLILVLLGANKAVRGPLSTHRRQGILLHA